MNIISSHRDLTSAHKDSELRSPITSEAALLETYPSLFPKIVELRLTVPHTIEDLTRLLEACPQLKRLSFVTSDELHPSTHNNDAKMLQVSLNAFSLALRRATCDGLEELEITSDGTLRDEMLLLIMMRWPNLISLKIDNDNRCRRDDGFGTRIWELALFLDHLPQLRTFHIAGQYSEVRQFTSRNPFLSDRRYELRRLIVETDSMSASALLFAQRNCPNLRRIHLPYIHLDLNTQLLSAFLTRVIYDCATKNLHALYLGPAAFLPKPGRGQSAFNLFVTSLVSIRHLELEFDGSQSAIEDPERWIDVFLRCWTRLRHLRIIIWGPMITHLHMSHHLLALKHLQSLHLEGFRRDNLIIGLLLRQCPYLTVKDIYVRAGEQPLEIPRPTPFHRRLTFRPSALHRQRGQCVIS